MSKMQVGANDTHERICRRAKVAALLGLGLLLVTAVANVWGVPSINIHVLPQVTQKASSILDRKVS